MSAPYDLLRKSELRVTHVQLDGADLSELAKAMADVLELGTQEVLVTDYLDNVLTFDVLRSTLYSHQLLGRSEQLLEALRSQPGLALEERARVMADGMLGWIAADGPAAETALDDAQRMAADINARISRRVGVFSTGAELVRGDVKDTNWTAIRERMQANGFACTHLGSLPDDRELIAGSIRRAIDTGYGVVVTTGGVGAEAKDCTVEAVETLAPNAVTPFTCRFEKGHGRHVKDGIRIAVATVRGSRIVSLPGPNDEVLACLDAVVDGLDGGAPDHVLAQTIAEILRRGLHDRMGHPRRGSAQ